MIEQRWIDALDSPDVERRKQAVIAITNSGDPDAFDLLAKVFRNDKNPDVRELARQGGLRLREQRDQPPRPTATPETSVIHTPRTSREAWSDITPYLFLYGLFIAAVMLVIFILFDQMLDDFLVSFENEPGFQQATQEVEISTFGWVVYAIGYGIFGVLALVVQVFIADYLAINTFGGEGDMFAFIRKFAPVNAALTVLVTGALLLLVGTFLGNIDETTMTTTNTSGDAVMNVVCTLLCGMLLALLGVIYFFGQMIGTHYRITTFQGIVAFIVGGIAVQAVSSLFFSAADVFLAPFV